MTGQINAFISPTQPSEAVYIHHAHSRWSLILYGKCPIGALVNNGPAPSQSKPRVIRWGFLWSGGVPPKAHLSIYGGYERDVCTKCLLIR